MRARGSRLRECTQKVPFISSDCEQFKVLRTSRSPSGFLLFVCCCFFSPGPDVFDVAEIRGRGVFEGPFCFWPRSKAFGCCCGRIRFQSDHAGYYPAGQTWLSSEKSRGESGVFVARLMFTLRALLGNIFLSLRYKLEKREVEGFLCRLL